MSALTLHGLAGDPLPPADTPPFSGGRWCRAKRDEGYVCTASAGHDGHHVAHTFGPIYSLDVGPGATAVAVATWPQEQAS